MYFFGLDKIFERKIQLYTSCFSSFPVHNIYHPCRVNCCSPEPTDLQCPPPCDIRLQRRLRRVTRRYEAARRNGHYAVSPAIVDDETTLKTPGKAGWKAGVVRASAVSL